MPRAVFVTDFDGTLSRFDFYHLARARLVPPGTPNFFADYSLGRLTHFECLAATYAAITATEAEVVAGLRDLDFEPRFAECLARLADRGWEVVVASAGCGWYIDKMLGGVAVVVHANRGHWAGGGRGLVMELPTDSPFFSPTVGIDKPAVVRDALQRADVVAYAGDGFTDVPALMLVRPELRFAKADAAATLAAEGEAFRPFDRWAEVADALVDEGW